MTTLLTEPVVASAHRSADAADRRAAQSAPGVAAAPVSSQVAEFCAKSGLQKVDILIFLAIYALIVLVGAGLCLAGPVGHPKVWEWGLHLMNVPLAAAGAGMLILATVSAAAALAFAQRNRRIWTTTALALTTVLCMAFVGTLAIDVDTKWAYGIRPGAQFRPNERYLAHRFGVKLPRKKRGENAALAAAAAVTPPPRHVDAANGRKLFLGTCMTCHGVHGEGLPGQGKPLGTSEFVRSLDDAKLLDFVKAGRAPWDPANTTKVQMPPRGGNPLLSDDDLRDIVAYVRTLQASSSQAPAVPADGSTAAQTAAAGAGAAVAAALPEEAIDPSLLLPRWVVSAPPDTPRNVSAVYLADFTRPKWMPPRDSAAFVNGYHFAVEFGGLHAALIAIAFAALFVLSVRRRFSADLRAPLALGLAGCAVMTATWLIIFPFIYVV